MEDRDNFIEETKEWVAKSEEAIKNLTNFADNMVKDLPKEERDKLQRELGSVDLSDISSTIASVMKDIDGFNKKYSR